MALVLVDGENVRRSVWPNITRERLAALSAAWGAENGHEVRIVWEGAPETADDALVRAAAAAEEPFWLVTSDRGLRARVAGAARVVGGGTFARELAR